VVHPPFFDDDAQLADRARQGDREAFGALVEKFQRAIYSYALHFFRNPTRAEDLTQETFLRAFRFLHTYDPSRRFSTWLYAVARNLCIDGHREGVRENHADLDTLHPRHLVASPGAPNPLQQLEDREDRERLLRAVHQLPEKYRTPVILCYMQGLPYQEISDILGISLNNTKIRIFRAKKVIVKLLGVEEGGE
jgi:RNA polymerase sigma-70 factor (ECF subfamily)